MIFARISPILPFGTVQSISNALFSFAAPHAEAFNRFAEFAFPLTMAFSTFGIFGVSCALPLSLFAWGGVKFPKGDHVRWATHFESAGDKFARLVDEAIKRGDIDSALKYLLEMNDNFDNASDLWEKVDEPMNVARTIIKSSAVTKKVAEMAEENGNSKIAGDLSWQARTLWNKAYDMLPENVVTMISSIVAKETKVFLKVPNADMMKVFITKFWDIHSGIVKLRDSAVEIGDAREVAKAIRCLKAMESLEEWVKSTGLMEERVLYSVERSVLTVEHDTVVVRLECKDGGTEILYTSGKGISLAAKAMELTVKEYLENIFMQQ